MNLVVLLEEIMKDMDTWEDADLLNAFCLEKMVVVDVYALEGHLCMLWG